MMDSFTLFREPPQEEEFMTQADPEVITQDFDFDQAAFEEPYDSIDVEAMYNKTRRRRTVKKAKKPAKKAKAKKAKAKRVAKKKTPCARKPRAPCRTKTGQFKKCKRTCHTKTGKVKKCNCRK